MFLKVEILTNQWKNNLVSEIYEFFKFSDIFLQTYIKKIDYFTYLEIKFWIKYQ